MKVSKPMRITSVIIILTAFYLQAKAAPVYTNQSLKGITASEAIKAAKSGVIFKCSKAKLGPNASPVKVSGSKTIFTTAKVVNDDSALDSIIDGGSAYKCQAQVWDADRRKLVNHNE